MPTVASNVRISVNADQVLARLAERLKRPKSQVVEEALRQMEEGLFWREVREAFADGEPDDVRKDRELWDETVGDGLKAGDW